MNEQEMERRVTAVEERAKSNTHRINQVEKRQEDSEKMLHSIALIAQRQDSMEVDVKEIKADVKSLAAKPGKRWDSIVDKILLAAVGALVAYIAVRLGLG